MERTMQTLQCDRGTLFGTAETSPREVPEGAMILGENQYYSRDCIKTQLNNNVIVVGTSGAGKTRSIVMPNLLQATGSYIVSDPKGNLAKKMGPYLKSKGYEVITMDFIHPEKSLRYNPIGYCHTTTEARKLAHILVYEMSKMSGGKTVDPFWDETSEILISACIGYMLETNELKENQKNLITLAKLIKEANRDQRGISAARGRSQLDQRMEAHREMMSREKKVSWAVERYDEYNASPDKTQATINVCALAKMATFDTIETRKMLVANDIDFTSIGKKPTALFVEVSDTDRSMDILVNLFYSQLMNELCMFADDKCKNSCLPVPVQFILDDFATNARIENFHNMIANIRSRGISAMIMVQSEAQLNAGYDVNAQTIIDNCNTYVYMGGSNPHMAEVIAKRANKPASRILNMPLGMSWVFRRGQEPILCRNFDIEWFQRVKGLVPRKEEMQGQPDEIGRE